MDNDDPVFDPENYVWRLFYVNRNDSRVFVPKRIPMMGFTINFGNPRSGYFLIATAAFIVLFFISRDFLS